MDITEFASRGGKARADSLTKRRRQEIAKAGGLKAKANRLKRAKLAGLKGEGY